MDLKDIKFKGRLYGTYKVIDILDGNIINSTVWKMRCIYCNKEIDMVASKVIKDYIDNRVIKCNCGCNSIIKGDKVYSVDKVDRERLKKIRYNIIKKSANSEQGIVESSWLDSLDRFVEWAIESGYRPYKRLYRKRIDSGYTKDNCYWALQYGRKDKDESDGRLIDISYTDEIEDIAKRMGLSNGGISVKLYTRIDKDIDSIIKLVNDFDKHSKALILLGGVDSKRIEDTLIRLRKVIENIELVKEGMGLNG